MAGIGASLGYAVFASYAQWLVSRYGWRAAYQGIAAASLIVGYANLSLVRLPKPQKRVNRMHAAPAVMRDGPKFAAIVRSPVFWRLAGAYLLLCTMVNGNFVHLVPMLTDRGEPPADAAKMIIYLGATSLVGRLACGSLLLWINPARLGAAVFLLGSIGATMLLRTGGHLQVVSGVVLLGSCFGAEGELLNYSGRYAFGLRAQASVLGALTAAFLFGTLLGPMLMSICRDQTGSYQIAQIALVGMGVTAAVLHWGFRPMAGVIPIVGDDTD